MENVKHKDFLMMEKRMNGKLGISKIELAPLGWRFTAHKGNANGTSPLLLFTVSEFHVNMCVVVHNTL